MGWSEGGALDLHERFVEAAQRLRDVERDLVVLCGEATRGGRTWDWCGGHLNLSGRQAINRFGPGGSTAGRERRRSGVDLKRFDKPQPGHTP